MRVSIPAAAAVAIAVAVSGCGSSNSDSVASQTGQASITGPASTTTVAVAPQPTYAYSGTTTTASTPARTTATAATTDTITRPNSGGAGLTTPGSSTSTCMGADLAPAAAPPNGATGTVVLGFTLRNTSSSDCRTYGWPGIAFVNSAGSAVSTQTTRTTSDILGATPPKQFSIAPGAEASFRITVHDTNDQGSEAGCGSYGAVQIIAPGDTAGMQVKLPNGSVEVCGAADVSPLEPGAGATGQ